MQSIIRISSVFKGQIDLVSIKGQVATLASETLQVFKQVKIVGHADEPSPLQLPLLSVFLL